MTRNVKRRQKIVVRVLGATEIRVGTRLIELKTEVLFALALYMTTRAGELVSREELLEVFWPEGKEEDRRHAMRQMFYRLRQVGIDPDDEGDGLRLDPGLVDSDVVACLKPDWSERAGPAEIEKAVLLQSAFSSRMPSGFLEWFDGVRAGVARQCTRAALVLMNQARSRGRWADLEHWARTVLSADPLNEEAILARAEASAMSGAKAEALEILDGYLLDLGPTVSDLHKPAMLLRKRIAERRVGWKPEGSREVSLIGRADAMEAITRVVELAFAGQHGSLLIVGPSGFGKTRLLGEATEYAALRGLKSISVRAEVPLAHNSFALARDIAKQLLEQPGSAGTSPRAMASVASFIQETADAPAALTYSPATTAAEIHRSLAALLAAVSEERKLLLVVDDLQYADAESVDVLCGLLASLAGTRTAIILASQPAGLDRLSLARLSTGPLIARLGPLSHDEARDLASATAHSYGQALGEPEVSSIAMKSGGHPLFARELAIAFVRSPHFKDLPATLRDTVSRNLAKQGQSELHILRLIALLGPLASTARVQALSGQPSPDFIRSLEALSADGVIQLDKSQSLRLHDCWSEAVLGSTSAAVCAAVALACAQDLEAQPQSLSINVSRRVADLYRLAGDNERAVMHSLASIDALFGAGLYSSALETVDLELQSTPPGVTRSRLVVRRAMGLLATGEPKLALELAEDVWRSRALQGSSFMKDHLLAVEVAADCRMKLDMADRGPSVELLSLAKCGALAPHDRARASFLGIRMVVNAADASLSRDFASAVRDLGEIGPLSPAGALALLIEAGEFGTAAEIMAVYEQFGSLDLQGVSILDRTMLLRCSAHALRVAGDLAGAVPNATSAYQLALEHGLDFSARIAAELLCHMYLDWNRLDDAEGWLRRLQNRAGEYTNGNTVASGEHLRDRFVYAAEGATAAAGPVRNRLEVVRAQGRTVGTCGELSLAAAVVCETGTRAEGSIILDEALESTRPFVGRNAADFALDMCLRAETFIGSASASDLAIRHIRARRAARRPPPAPGFSALRALSDELI